ncbi:hypothetical protein KC343_g19327 [Hortaea werneckii]|nr:hypothetical protein KC343_g19327 [Hortaea werneckii]
MSDKPGMAYVEDVEDGIKPMTDDPVMGTTKIEGGDDVILVPAPSADPRDPLNLPKWRKALFVVLTSICNIIQGLGGLLTFYIPEYSKAGATYADITALMTYPTMFMGVGNLICMPIALAVGRRPVYLFSLALLIASSVLAAYAKDYNWHLGARMAMGLAVGNSEALVPMMISEIHFIHERAQHLMWQRQVWPQSSYYAPVPLREPSGLATGITWELP